MNRPYIICPQCGVRRFFVVRELQRIVFMLTGKGEIEMIDNSLSPIEITNTDEEVQCLGCSWKGTLRKLLKQ